MTETHTLIDLADIIHQVDPSVKIQHLPNPRKELESNSLRVKNDRFINLGLNPIKVNKESLKEIMDDIKKYNRKFNTEVILPKSFW